MTTVAVSLFRSLLIYGICVPLALMLGYLITTPDDLTSFRVVGGVLMLCLIPLLLRWHHAWLFATWNMTVVLFFLPGQPLVWLALVWISLLIGLVGYMLNRNRRFLHVPELSKPLILMAIVVLVTAKFTGGFGMRSFGSDTIGAKRYFIVLSSIAGYFALTSQQIPRHRVPLYVALYFLGAITMAVGELATVVSPGFYWLFAIFPVHSAGLQAIANDPRAQAGFAARLGGLATAASGGYLLMLCRYGIRGLFGFRRMGRLIILVGLVIVAMLGGFRSTLILLLLTFVILFYLEGLLRSPLFPALLLVGLLGSLIVLPVTDRLPVVVQRSLSFLPVAIDPVVKASAESSTEWRVQMWKHVLPDVPEYLLLGKGYSMTAKDLAMARIMGPGTTGSESSELAGDYHNGPLSVIVPFGIPGTVAFIWFLAAGFKVLRRNYIFGDPAFHGINTFLLAYFTARVILFFLVFGGLYSDLAIFIGLIALSVSINGGMARKAAAPAQRVMVINRFKLQPPGTKPVAA